MSIKKTYKTTEIQIRKWDSCNGAVEWIEQQDTEDVFELIERLRKSRIKHKHAWLCWAIPRLLKTKKNRVRFAVYCAELTLPVFEKEHPNDKRPRKVIQAVKNWVNNPIEKNSIIAWAIAKTIMATGWTTLAVRVIARTVAADVVGTARGATRAAMAAIEVAWDIKDKEIIDEIIDYGIKLLKEELH